VVFHKPMVLLDDIIQLLTLSELTVLWKRAYVLEGVEGQWICGMLVDGNDAREHGMARAQHLPEEPFDCIGITSALRVASA
jgi:hypothetical protein